MMRALNLVPPQTKLEDVVRQLEAYQATEVVVSAE